MGGAPAGGGRPIVAVPLGSDPEATGLYEDARLAGLASILLGGPAECFGCSFIIKEAAGSDVVPGASVAAWHQDGHPWLVSMGIEEAVTLWVPLDRAGPQEGGLAVIPGSHSLPAQPLCADGVVPVWAGADRSAERVGAKETSGAVGAKETGGAGGSLFGGGIDGCLVDPTSAAFLTLERGDVSAHHSALIHGSPANLTASRRRALVLRYRAGR